MKIVNRQKNRNFLSAFVTGVFLWINFFLPLRIRRIALISLLPLALLCSSHQGSYLFTAKNNASYLGEKIPKSVGDSTSSRYIRDQKQRGMHFFGAWSPAAEHFQELVDNHIEWIVHVPYGWQDNVESTEIQLSIHNRGTWRKDASISNAAKTGRKYGLHSMLKPHLWLHNTTSDKWRGTIQFNNTADWKAWSASYEAFILHYARLAAQLDMEAFCIGTELHQTAIQHPEYWRALIRKVRKIFKGQLTYAANWDREFEEITFWEELDFIGVQAYFPLTDQKNPSVRKLVAGWQPAAARLEAISRKHNRPILFTEIGYKSTNDAAIEPWIWVNDISTFYTKQSYKTQANCYEAFFRVFWKKDWFAGAHMWQWKAGIDIKQGKGNISFTPQQKPAQNIMAKWFGKVVR